MVKRSEGKQGDRGGGQGVCGPKFEGMSWGGRIQRIHGEIPRSISE